MYTMNFKKEIPEEKRAEKLSGSHLLGRQFKLEPDIKIIPTSPTRQMNMDFAVSGSKIQNARSIMMETNRSKQIQDYQDTRCDREGMHNISSRGLMFTESQLEIDERASFGAILHEQNKLHGRTQL